MNMQRITVIKYKNLLTVAFSWAGFTMHEVSINGDMTKHFQLILNNLFTQFTHAYTSINKAQYLHHIPAPSPQDSHNHITFYIAVHIYNFFNIH